MFVTLLTTPLSSVGKSRLDRPTVVADVPRRSYLKVALAGATLRELFKRM